MQQIHASAADDTLACGVTRGAHLACNAATAVETRTGLFCALLLLLTFAGIDSPCRALLDAYRFLPAWLWQFRKVCPGAYAMEQVYKSAGEGAIA